MSRLIPPSAHRMHSKKIDSTVIEPRSSPAKRASGAARGARGAGWAARGALRAESIAQISLYWKACTEIALIAQPGSTPSTRTFDIGTVTVVSITPSVRVVVTCTSLP